MPSKVTVTVAVQCTAVCILPVRLLVGALQSLNVDLEALSSSVIKLLDISDINYYLLNPITLRKPIF